MTMRMRMFPYSWCEGSSPSHSSVSQSSCVSSSKRSFWIFFAIPTEEWFSWEEGHQTDPFFCCFPSVHTVRLLDYPGVCRCQMWTARCWSTGRAHCNRTWILLTQSGCSGSICHVESGGGSALTCHWCHPSSHTRPAHSRVTQPDLQARSILLLLTATLSMLLQLLFTGSYIAPPQTFPHRTFLFFLNF